MQRDFASRFTGSSFLAAAVMTWGGWMLLPHHLGAYFQPGDFEAVHEHLRLWLWMYRFHLFGVVFTAIAVAALASMIDDRQARPAVWAGAAVAVAGAIVGAVGSAFYYHHGVWGALTMHGKSPDELQAFVKALEVDTEYVTCLVRFGRVFFGLGLLILMIGLIKCTAMSWCITSAGIALGVAAMALTMLLPDRWDLFQPVFHAQAVWLAVMGFVILRRGIN